MAVLPREPKQMIEDPEAGRRASAGLPSQNRSQSAQAGNAGMAAILYATDSLNKVIAPMRCLFDLSQMGKIERDYMHSIVWLMDIRVGYVASMFEIVRAVSLTRLHHEIATIIDVPDITTPKRLEKNSMLIRFISAKPIDNDRIHDHLASMNVVPEITPEGWIRIPYRAITFKGPPSDE